jgi:hypothetical protein
LGGEREDDSAYRPDRVGNDGHPCLGVFSSSFVLVNESREYLRSVCQGYAKDRKTLKQIAMYVDEPEKINDFGRACKKLGVSLKAN